MRISDWSSDVCSSDLILRGPQGTLFGRNVTGGAVTVRSARPTQETSAKMMLGVVNGAMFEGSAVANGPIVTDTLSARMAVLGSSEVSRVGQECVSTCRSRGSTYH